MAPPNPKKKDPPPASSSDEDDSSSEKSTSSNDDEEENPTAAPPKSISKPNPKTTPNTDEESGSSSDTSTNDDSDSDEESAPKQQQPVKPVAKVKEETLTLTEAQPKLKPAEVSSSQIKTKKRKIESATPDVHEGNKKAKKDEEPKTEETKKVLFQRRFSEEDEIALLEGLHEFTKIGKDIVSDVDGFFEYVKDFIKCEFNKHQMNDKIRRLKRKYINNSSRKRKNREDPVFSRPHDLKSYNLSKMIWGEREGFSTPTKSLTTLKSQADGKAVRKLDLGSAVDKKIGSFKDLNESAVKYGLEMVDETKRAELEERWKKLCMAHMEVFVKKTELTLKLAESALGHVKSANR
jgi:hypothetical protein